MHFGLYRLQAVCQTFYWAADGLKKFYLTFCLIGAKVARKSEVNDLADEKKVTINNDDGDSAEINLQRPAPAVDENITEDTSDAAAELEQLKADLAAKDERILRLQADFDNFRKRTAREKSELAAVIEQAFLKDLLPLLDNL
ncbi:MAG: nucleotide exchange factor GrpE, partial [Quinella sp. 1Q7]|nr:nucleotide exchange factor GrpE [Quinella sp. 1Q7]